MRELAATELEQVSGGVEGEVTVNAGRNERDGNFFNMGMTIRFGGAERPPSSDRRRAPSNDGAEAAFTATAMRPRP